MKAHFHKVPISHQGSYSIRLDKQPVFPTLWHYHPELELHFVVKGDGVKLIGDNISNFESGEVILLGENLPHSWHCSEKYFQNDSKLNVEAIVLHFLPTFLGREFLELQESLPIKELFSKAKRGMILYGKTKEKVAKIMQNALQAKNLDRIIVLLNILKVLSETKEYKIITSAHAFYKSNESETIRLNKINAYTISNYKKQISLEEISKISNLSVTSFCRYFKLMTKKTYYEFLNELRISHACRHIIEDKLTTSAICFECGFNNIANFYRHFKKITGVTPFQYKRKYFANTND